MRIYAACLASYNAGKLHGVWIDVKGKTADDLQEEINAMLAASREPGAEEYAIHDYEDIPSSFGEHPSLDDIAAYVALVEEHGDAARAAYENFRSVSEAGDAMEHYAGSYKGLDYFAEEYLDDSGVLSNLPDNLRSYFDYEKFGRDLVLGGDVWIADNEEGWGIHVFWNR